MLYKKGIVLDKLKAYPRGRAELVIHCVYLWVVGRKPVSHSTVQMVSLDIDDENR